jgi:hypothetical protein
MRILGLRAKAFGFDIVFTIVEIVTMAVWLQLVLKGHIIAGTTVLVAGLFIEHTLSLLAGKFNTF